MHLSIRRQLAVWVPNLVVLLHSAPRTPIRTQALIAQHEPLVPGVRTRGELRYMALAMEHETIAYRSLLMLAEAVLVSP